MRAGIRMALAKDGIRVCAEAESVQELVTACCMGVVFQRSADLTRTYAITDGQSLRETRRSGPVFPSLWASGLPLYESGPPTETTISATRGATGEPQVVKSFGIRQVCFRL